MVSNKGEEGDVNDTPSINID